MVTKSYPINDSRQSKYVISAMYVIFVKPTHALTCVYVPPLKIALFIIH